LKELGPKNLNRIVAQSSHSWWLILFVYLLPNEQLNPVFEALSMASGVSFCDLHKAPAQFPNLFTQGVTPFHFVRSHLASGVTGSRLHALP
jgi:hypothetical protein